MSIKTVEILDELKSLTKLEAADLVKQSAVNVSSTKPSTDSNDRNTLDSE
jgi:hypothetical protein